METSTLNRRDRTPPDLLDRQELAVHLGTET